MCLTFQNISRKVVHLPSMDFSIHPGYHCTSNYAYRHCYENLHEERDETLSLWKLNKYYVCKYESMAYACLL